MMKKNKPLLICIAIAVTVLLVIFSCKPQMEKTYVIGIINPNPEAREGVKGFINSMEDFGYVEGENITYIKHKGKEKIEDALREMVAENVDLIFTHTTPATQKAKQITEHTDIPVVFIVFDSIGSGLVESLSRPTGNLTGVQLIGSTPKSLEWLSAVSPDIKNIFVPVSFDTKAAYQSLEALKKTASKLNIKITVDESSTVEELHASLSSIPEEIDSIFILHSILIGSNVKTIIDTAIKQKIPIASSGHEHHKIGAVVCYGTEAVRVGSQAARLANKLLKGAAPETLPVEHAEYVLGINLRTAREIGIEVPDTILKQADYIIR
jgi:putative ABC transport system substrate-binding protein